MGDRAGIERGGRLSLRKRRDLGAISLLGRRYREKFKEGAASDGDLTVIGIGDRKAPFKIAEERQRILPLEPDLPGLAIMGIGRQEGVRQSPAPELVILTGAPPGLPGLRRGPVKSDESGARGRRDDHPSSDEDKNIATRAHSRLSLFDIKLNKV